MALTSVGRIYVCPCCGFGIPFSFEEKTLLSLQPGSIVQSTRGSDIPLTRSSHKYRVCRQCGFIPDLPADDENNKWAMLNALRIKFTSTPLKTSQSPDKGVHVNPTDDAPVKELLHHVVAVTNEVPPTLTDDDSIALLELSDDLDAEVPPSAAGVKAAARAAK